MAGYTRQSLAAIQDGEDIIAAPLNAEFNQLQDAFNAVTGHVHDGTIGNGPKISLTGAVSGILPIANGGTGKSTIAIDKIWYSSALNVLSETAITAYARTLIDDADATTARATLGVTIGTQVQAWDAGLQSISGLTTAADRMIYTTASDTYAVTTLTSFARTLLDDADATTARATLGAVIGTNVQAWDVNLDQIAALAVTDGNFIVGNGTAWVVESGATARASMGADNASNLTTGTLPSARLTGAYTSGVTDFTMTGLFTLSNTAPILRLQDTTASAYDGRLRLDANNIYIDGSSDGSTYNEVLRFELDTRIGYMEQLFFTSDDGEKLRFDTTTATVDPYISWYQAGTRKAYIQYTDGAGTAAGLRIQNDAVAGDSILFLTNDGGVAGFRYYNNGNNYEVWHSGNLTVADIGAVPTSRTLTAGNGLTGGGDLTANRTFTLGTPSDITNSTTNSVTATSHTHALGFTAAEVYLGTGAADTSLPLGHIIVVFTDVSSINRNATVVPTLGTSGSTFYIESGDANAGTALSGTWRSSGAITYSGQTFILARRVA